MAHLEMSRLNATARLNMRVMSVTLVTSHFETSVLNNVVLKNIPCMEVTRDTSQFEISPLKEFALANKPRISLALDTSHVAISPCGAWEQSPVGDNLRHASTAPLISALDENVVVVVVHTVSDIDPDEPVNIFVLLAFEFIQLSPQRT